MVVDILASSVDIVQIDGHSRDITVRSETANIPTVNFTCDDCRGNEIKITEPATVGRFYLDCTSPKVDRGCQSMDAEINMLWDSEHWDRHDEEHGLWVNCIGYETCKSSDFVITGGSPQAEISCEGI